MQKHGVEALYYHSPVLTATGFFNGRGQILTPTESTLLDRSPKNLFLVITSVAPTAVPNLVQICPRGGASEQMGEILRKFYLFIYLFIYTFLGTHLQVRPVNGFSRLMAETTRTRSRMCQPFGGFVDIAAHFGGEIPQNPNFWGVNRRFQAKRAKY